MSKKSDPSELRSILGSESWDFEKNGHFLDKREEHEGVEEDLRCTDPLFLDFSQKLEDSAGYRHGSDGKSGSGN